MRTSSLSSPRQQRRVGGGKSFEVCVGWARIEPSSVCVLFLLDFTGTVDLRWVAVGEGWPSESAKPNR